MKKVLVLFVAVLLNVNVYAQGTPDNGGESKKDEVSVTTADFVQGEVKEKDALSGASDNETSEEGQAQEVQAQPEDMSADISNSVFEDFGMEESQKTKTLTVTATKTEHTLREIPMTVNVITAEDIAKNPSSSVAEIIGRLPGITLEDNGAAGAIKVKIRGEASKRTLVIIDGVRQNEHAPSTGALPIMIAPADIERIEVIKGPSSVLYGSDAIGGVVNIITKKGADKPFSLTQRSIYDSSSQRHDFYVAASGSYKGFFYMTGYNAVKSDLRNTPAGELIGTDYKKENYTGKLGYTWNKGELSFGTQHHDDDLNSRSGLNNPPNVIPMDFSRHAYDMNFVLKDITNNFVRFNINAAQQEIKRETNSFLRKTDSYTLSPQTDWVFGDHYVIVGGQYNNDDFKNTQVSNGAVSDASLWDASAFIQDEWTIIEKLAVTLGARQSWYHSSSGSKSKDIDRLVGSAGAVYMLNDLVSFRAQFSQGFKTPAIYETMMGSSMLIANPDLDPEESNNFDIGAIITSGGLNVNTSLFYTKAKNYIAWRQIGMQMRPENINEAETYGAELGISYDISSFTPYVAATYIDRTFWNAPGSRVRKSNRSGISPFYGEAGVRWKQDIEGFTLFSDLKGIWASECESESASGVITKKEAWQTFNLQLGVQKDKYFVTIDINNICDEKYIKAESSANFYEAGAHVVLSAGFTF